MNASNCYSLGILAGGQGRRWGGRDKGLIIWRGRPLIDHICQARPAAAAELLICCRSNARFYQHYGDRVLGETQELAGPCAGIVALLAANTAPSLIVVPVDLIGAPNRVIQLLETKWRDDDVALVLHDDEGRHSPCVRLRSEVKSQCEAYLDCGGNKLVDLFRAVNARSVAVASEWLTDADEPESLMSGHGWVASRTKKSP